MASNQFAFATMLPERWASSGSLAAVIVFDLLVALANAASSGLLEPCTPHRLTIRYVLPKLELPS
jgi:hypothetical protein